jgi:hypothetical protein
MTVVHIIFELIALFAYLGLLIAASRMIASHEARTPRRVRLEALHGASWACFSKELAVGVLA